VIVRELVTLLGFRTDPAGAEAYERTFSRVQGRAAEATASMSNWAEGMVRQAKLAVTAWAGFQGVKSVIEAADNLTTTMNRINAALPQESAEGVQAVFDQIYKSATETGVATDKTAQAFMRFAPAMRKLGYDADSTVQMLDGIQKGMIAGGQSAGETGEVIRQLGQAITSTVFQGDELRSFMEGASATMIESFAAQLGVTTDKLKKMGSEGNLTAKVVLPALIAASKAGRDEFGRMEVTTSLAMARARVVLTHTLANFNKVTQISKYAALSIQNFVNSLLKIEDFLPTLDRFIKEMGGMDRIVQVVIVTMGGLLAAVVAVNRALVITALRSAAAWAPWIIGGIAIAAVAALVMDFVEWIGGEDVDSQFRRWFGPFDEFTKEQGPAIAKVKEAWQQFKDIVRETYIQLSADGENFWPPLLEYLGILWRTMDEVGRFIGTTLRGMVEAARTDFAEFIKIVETSIGAVVAAFQTVVGWIDRAVAAWQRWIGRDGPTPNETNPAGGAGPRRGTLRGLNTEGFYRPDDMIPLGDLLNTDPLYAGAAGAIGRSSTANINAPQNNTITNSVTVNATGASAPEVAAGVTEGMGRATDGMANSLRDVQASMPLVEAPSR